MPRKKILQICAIDTSFEVLLVPLIKATENAGYEVHNACTNTGKFEHLKNEGLTMVPVEIDRKITPLGNLRSIYNLYKIMKKEKYDIVHVHTPIAALLGRIAAKFARVKTIIYTAHGFYFHDEMPTIRYKFYYNIEKYAARLLTDWILLQSEEDYNLALKEKFLNKDRIIHLGNGVDIQNRFELSLISEEKKQSLRKDLGIKENEIVFSFIGRLVKEKGIIDLLNAFNKLRSDYTSIRLLVIGDFLESERDQDSRLEIEKLLAKPGVIHTGFRKDIPELLSISDTFILPSYREGLPRSIIEAMAMELPIIATDIRGCREEVFNNANGFLIEKGSVKQLYDSMKKLLLNEQLRQKFGSESRKIVEEQFDEQKVIEKQLNLFQKVTS